MPIQEQKTYYSESAGLAITINPGDVKNMEGVLKRVGDKYVRFAPLGRKFKRTNPSTGRQETFDIGMLTTSDPEVIESLDRRMAEVGDIFDAAEFERRVTPVEIQMANLQRELTRTQGELQEVLRSQGKLPKNTTPARV